MDKFDRHSTVIYVRGLPGSGKSFIAAQLRDVLGDSVVLLDPDSVDVNSDTYRAHVQEQIEEGVDETLHLYRFLRAQAYQAIEDGKTIIWNQPFSNSEILHKAVGRLKEHAAAHNVKLHIVIVEVTVDPLIAKQRIAERKAAGGHGPSNDRFAKFLNDYRSFAGQGYPVVTVSGNDDPATAIAAIQTVLRDLH